MRENRGENEMGKVFKNNRIVRIGEIRGRMVRDRLNSDSDSA